MKDSSESSSFHVEKFARSTRIVGHSVHGEPRRPRTIRVGRRMPVAPSGRGLRLMATPVNSSIASPCAPTPGRAKVSAVARATPKGSFGDNLLIVGL
jgi:hypothetical protein